VAQGGRPQELWAFCRPHECAIRRLQPGQEEHYSEHPAPKGKQIFLDLVEVSDVVLENFRPGTMDRMGFSYENLSKVNPGIILASVSGFGQYGPYRDRQCLDPIIQGMSGIGYQTGHGFDQPIMDRTAALHATIGILGALRHRDRTGEGQWLEVAMMDGGITLEKWPWPCAMRPAPTTSSAAGLLSGARTAG
jgi:crotonobetainyl-CoA:carnitine CoA-transferase CaiB-like acyl-CoA transferase